MPSFTMQNEARQLAPCDLSATKETETSCLQGYARHIRCTWRRLGSTMSGLCGDSGGSTVQPPQVRSGHGRGGSFSRNHSPKKGLKPITHADLEKAAAEVSSNVKRWDGKTFTLVSHLQDASRNFGQVNLMRNNSDCGREVAVKTMPTKWMTSGPRQFQRAYPRSSEQPWKDLGILRQLNKISYPYACELLGVFRDDQQTYVVTSVATEGDLFSWCFIGPPPGARREKWMRPVVSQVFAAVRWLHELGIAHRDISLENLLVTTDPGCNGPLVKVIDFGMATLSQAACREVRGKPSYQAPEMHCAEPYDCFRADAFSVGVVLFTLGTQEYPWKSTVPGTCPQFARACAFGLSSVLGKHGRRGLLSPAALDLAEGLLDMDPQERLGLGESRDGARRSAWDLGWLESGVAGPPLRPQQQAGAARCVRAARGDPCRLSGRQTASAKRM